MRNAYWLGCVVGIVTSFIYGIFNAVGVPFWVLAVLFCINWFIIILGVQVAKSWETDEEPRHLS